MRCITEARRKKEAKKKEKKKSDSVLQLQVSISVKEIMGKTKKCISPERNTYSVRELKTEDKIQFEDFLYDTFYVPENFEPLPREIVNLPYCQKFIRNLGGKKGDCCYIAQDDLTGDIIGVVWTRIIDGTSIDSDTPFLLISVSAGYRGRGIGQSLLLHILAKLKDDGYTKVSLTVNKQNRAIRLYQRCGFSIYDSDIENYLMIIYL